ncbi:MAG TPA: MqnA/MqnD/SBP family protein [bacterium]|nr:MqnA/MqnD/SBP family protein [bacterium]
MTLTASTLIRVGHSPDPDDAFMFYALAKAKIPLQGFRVEHVIEDIESLNQRALKAELEVTAVSCHAYAYLADQYAVMRSGSSVGDKYGPILVARSSSSPKSFVGDPRLKACGDDKPNILGKKIAVPGKFTTAYLALQLYEKDFEPVFIPFDRILDAVKSGKTDFGLVIHEGQITYQDHGLEKILDLGQWWDEKFGLPLPLGIDIIRRDLGEENIRSFSGLFKASIEYALSHRKPALEYAMRYGRGIAETDADRFVGMYVNHYTVDLGARGEEGLRLLLSEGYAKGILPRKIELDFV